MLRSSKRFSTFKSLCTMPLLCRYTRACHRRHCLEVLQRCAARYTDLKRLSQRTRRPRLLTGIAAAGHTQSQTGVSILKDRAACSALADGAQKLAALTELADQRCLGTSIQDHKRFGISILDKDSLIAVLEPFKKSEDVPDYCKHVSTTFTALAQNYRLICIPITARQGADDLHSA